MSNPIPDRAGLKRVIEARRSELKKAVCAAVDELEQRQDIRPSEVLRYLIAAVGPRGSRRTLQRHFATVILRARRICRERYLPQKHMPAMKLIEAMKQGA
jgi:hypothetical protein